MVALQESTEYAHSSPPVHWVFGRQLCNHFSFHTLWTPLSSKVTVVYNTVCLCIGAISSIYYYNGLQYFLQHRSRDVFFGNILDFCSNRATATATVLVIWKKAALNIIIYINDYFPISIQPGNRRWFKSHSMDDMAITTLHWLIGLLFELQMVVLI